LCSHGQILDWALRGGMYMHNWKSDNQYHLASLLIIPLSKTQTYCNIAIYAVEFVALN
jgi:hypothetical protein